MRIVQVSLAVVLMTLAGCGSNEVLTPRNAAAPDGVDFSGTWVIRENGSADQRSIRRAISQTYGGNNTESKPRSASGRRKRSGLVDVFLETGRTLKITQTPYGFFVSVDRSVVEEFSFGEQRTISVGNIVGQRVSGWDGMVYVVETLDKNGMKLTERFSVSEDQNVLQREITFRSRNKKEETIVQRFDKMHPSSRGNQKANRTD